MATTVWNNEMRQFKAALARLPEDLDADAVDIVFGAADAAAAEIIAGYPLRTGRLRRGVKVSLRRTRVTSIATVRNSAPHAHLFDIGTQARHTKIGAPRGAMPPGHVFVPRIVRWRRIMYGQLKSMLTRHGLLVSGDA